MATFLDAEWFDEAVRTGSDLPARAGASAHLELVVSGAPGGDVRCTWDVEDGVLRRAGLGAATGAEGGAGVVQLTTSYADAVRMQRGELDPGAGFMQGRLKAAGDLRGLLAVLPLTVSSAWREWRDALAASTTFP